MLPRWFLSKRSNYLTRLALFCWLHRFVPSLDPWFDCRRNLALATSRSSPAFGGQEITLGKNGRLSKRSVQTYTQHFRPCFSSKLPSLITLRDSFFASLSYSDAILIHSHTSHGSINRFRVKRTFLSFPHLIFIYPHLTQFIFYRAHDPSTA